MRHHRAKRGHAYMRDDLSVMLAIDGNKCWICEMPTRRTSRGNDPLRASIDHTADGSLKVAHGWCNSRRGPESEPLTTEVMNECRQRIAVFMANA